MSENFQLKVPQMGEGLRFAKVVRILKSVGDWVEEDADIVDVETEKAVLGISSPKQGYIARIVCQPGDTVDVGATLLEISEDKIDVSVTPVGVALAQVRKGDRAQAPSLGVTKAEHMLPKKQRELIRHMHISSDIVVQASLEAQIDWGHIDSIKKTARNLNPKNVPSVLEIICWAVSQSMQSFPKFRWRMTAENAVVQSEDCRIGVAVSGDEDTLDTPVMIIEGSQSLTAVRSTFSSMMDKFHAGIETTGYHSVVISDMSSLQVFRAQPIVVYPAVATLFIGAPYLAPTLASNERRVSNFVLTFDHRIMNGAYAARFLKCINETIRRCALEVRSADDAGMNDHDKKLAA